MRKDVRLLLVGDGNLNFLLLLYSLYSFYLLYSLYLNIYQFQFQFQFL